MGLPELEPVMMALTLKVHKRENFLGSDIEICFFFLRQPWLTVAFNLQNFTPTGSQDNIKT
jgi:hypothetical protein